MPLSPIIPILGLLALPGLAGSWPGTRLDHESYPLLPRLLTHELDPRRPVTVRREAFVMGTRLRATVEAGSLAAATQAIEAVFAEVRRLEGVLSSWRRDSELGRLNSAPLGVPNEVSAELFELLEEARRWSEASGGAIEPAVGALIDAWDLRGEGRRPSEGELARALSWSGPGAFELDARSVRVTRCAEGGWITAGAFGKGAALRSAIRLLGEAGVESALLDFGGQIAAVGRTPDGGAWPVSVAHPSGRDRPAAELRLENVSAATSGASERFVEVDGERFGHIVDPRSGRPVAAWGSATAVAADPMVADLVSTAVFVLGPEAGLRWADSFEDIGVLVLREVEGRISARWNEAMQAWLAVRHEVESEDP